MPIPMYGGSNLSIIYIGMGQYRLFPMYRLKSQEQNTSAFDNSYQCRCIQIQHTSETQVFFKSRCIPINFPRCYLLSLVAYPRASRQKKQNTSEFNNLWQSRCIPINFPRCYLYSLAVYPRASRQKQTKYIGIQLFIAIPMYSN